MIYNELKKYEGEFVTGRTLNKISNALPDGYKYRAGVNGPEITAPSGNDHFLGWASSFKEPFKISLYERANSPYGSGAKERIEKLTKILSNKKELSEMISFFEDLSKVFAKLKDMVEQIDEKDYDSFHNPAYYAILKEINVNSRILSDIKYKSDKD